MDWTVIQTKTPHCEIVLWEGCQITSDNSWNQNDDSL